MKNRIKRFFTTNIGWKIAAIFLGVIIWAVISNTQDPVTTIDVPVKIEYLNEAKLKSEEKLTVISAPDRVTVVVRANKSKVSQVKGELFTATVDLMDHHGDYDKEENTITSLVSFKVEKANGSDSKFVLDWSNKNNDQSIKVVLGEYQEKTFTNIGLMSLGEFAEGVELASYEFSPAITVKGLKEKVGVVNSVMATVDLGVLNGIAPCENTLVKDSDGNAVTFPVRMYDSNGEEIRNADGALTMSYDSVRMQVTLSKRQTVGVFLESPETTGTPAYGFGVKKVSLSPAAITVKGVNEHLSEVSNITIPASMISVDGMNSTRTFDIDLAQFLPEDVRIAGETEKASVTVEIEVIQDQVDIAIDTAQIGIKGANEELYEYRVSGSPPPARLHGAMMDLNNLNVSEVTFGIDVEGLGEGEHEVPVYVNRQNGEALGFEVGNQQDLKVTVSITKKVKPTAPPQTQTETESESETASETDTENPESETGSSADESDDTAGSSGTENTDPSDNTGGETDSNETDGSSENEETQAPEDVPEDTAAESVPAEDTLSDTANEPGADEPEEPEGEQAHPGEGQ